MFFMVYEGQQGDGLLERICSRSWEATASYKNFTPKELRSPFSLDSDDEVWASVTSLTHSVKNTETFRKSFINFEFLF